jgi:hypothetical protein
MAMKWLQIRNDGIATIVEEITLAAHIQVARPRLFALLF